jgi:RNA polymerase sigma-70 factor (family 1)
MSSGIPNESMLVRELSKGSIVAFNLLYKTYSKRLYLFALRYFRSEKEAEELVQEVFAIIWEKREKLNEELSIKSFLFTIAFNIIRKHFRSKAQLVKYLNTGLAGDTDFQSAEDTNYQSLYQYLLKLIDQLPDRRREVFVKSRLEGLPNRQIADDMNISIKTVENHLSDAMRFLREQLNRESLPVILFYMLFIAR